MKAAIKFNIYYKLAELKGRRSIEHRSTICCPEDVREHAVMMYADYNMIPDVIDSLGISYKKSGKKTKIANFKVRYGKARKEKNRREDE